MKDFSINRRRAIEMIGAAAAVSAFDIDAALAYGPRIRENITTFAANPTKLAALKNGVQVMKQRSTVNQDDPTGWYYWAASHGTPNTPPQALINIYNQCQHGTDYFYPWHRAFLYYFEQTLRAASGDASFNLPYWNWYSTPAIPSAFTTPADASTNPLYHPRANNAVGPLSQTPFTRASFKYPPTPYPQFSEDLEGNPHGTVHDDIGGDMGDISTAAIDPIFWLHHCNVDRLWNVWVNEGHSNPAAGDPWSNQPFTYNVSGSMKKTAGQVINTVSMLGYKYDQEATPLQYRFNWHIVFANFLLARAFVLPGPGPVEHIAVSEETLATAKSRNATVASALGSGFSLGTKSSQVKFELSPENRSRVLTFAVSPHAPAANELQNVDLVLEGVEVTTEGKNGGYSFRVCVAVPAGDVNQADLDRQCVGELGSFKISVEKKHARMMGGNAGGGVTLRYPLGSAIKALGSKAFAGESVPVTFVAQHATLPTGQGNRTYVTVKSAHLELANGSGR